MARPAGRRPAPPAPRAADLPGPGPLLRQSHPAAGRLARRARSPGTVERPSGQSPPRPATDRQDRRATASHARIVRPDRRSAADANQAMMMAVRFTGGRIPAPLAPPTLVHVRRSWKFGRRRHLASALTLHSPSRAGCRPAGQLAVAARQRCSHRRGGRHPRKKQSVADRCRGFGQCPPLGERADVRRSRPRDAVFSGLGNPRLRCVSRRTKNITSERLHTLYRLPRQASWCPAPGDHSADPALAPAAPHLTWKASPWSWPSAPTSRMHDERRALEAAGYLAVETVTARGEFAVRGALMDIFPMGSEVAAAHRSHG